MAVVRRWSSSSVRATADPQSGRVPPGQGSSRVWPKPWARSPWLTVWARSQSSRPSRCSSQTARGVRPSPQVLSRGKTAASAITTSAPARAAHAAAADPAGPAPTTSTSAYAGGLVTRSLSQGAVRRRESPGPTSGVALGALTAQRREPLLGLRVALGVLEHPLLDVEVALGVVHLDVV